MFKVLASTTFSRNYFTLVHARVDGISLYLVEYKSSIAIFDDFKQAANVYVEILEAV